MKNRLILTYCLLMSAVFLTAQIPQKFRYQAVVRDAQNGLVTGQTVSFRMSILAGDADGNPVYVETHDVSTNGLGLAELVIGEGNVEQGSIEAIPWGEEAHYLKVEADRSGGSEYEHMGTSQLISVPYALVSANVASPTRKFTIQEETGHPVDSALFEVRNKEGQTVFAVYPEGTRVYVLDEANKGVKGGFAIGGFSRGAKGITQEYMRVTPDSIRLYLNNGASKAVKGGFAVGGFSRGAKAEQDMYFVLQPDSVRFTLFSDQDAGGNALSVETRLKGSGEASTGTSLFNLTRENYSIGHRAGESLQSGIGNIFFGYESGLNTVNGLNNVFIGPHSAKNTNGNHNVFIGADAGINTDAGSNNIMIGSGAGSDADVSNANIFIGSPSGFNNSGGIANVFVGMATGLENSKGSFNTFIGHGAGQFNAEDSSNTFLGAYSGHHNNGSMNTFIGMDAGVSHTDGDGNLFLGFASGANKVSGNNNLFIGNRAGDQNVSGSDNIFIGNEAGRDETGSGKLIINQGAEFSDQALIYGEFFTKKVRINSKLGVGRLPENNALEVDGEVSKTTSGDWLVNSDARIKHDIREIENALEQISRLRPVTFRYSEEWMRMNPGVRDRIYYNYVAQEYREVFPGSVRAGGGTLEGDPEPLLQIDSQPAQVVAIKAIQELIRQNEEQQELINELRRKVAALEAGSPR